MKQQLQDLIGDTDVAGPHIGQLIRQADDILQNCSESMESWQTALKKYQLAGRLGSGIACKKIGDLYCSGKHTDIDLKLALLNYNESVRLGHILALSDIAIVYTLLKDYQNIICSWERYFVTIDAEDIQDSRLSSKAIFYLLIKIRNDDLFQIYECFFKISHEILTEIDEESLGLVKSISQKIQHLKTVQDKGNTEELKEIQSSLVAGIHDLKDLRKCSVMFTHACAQRSNL